MNYTQTASMAFYTRHYQPTIDFDYMYIIKEYDRYNDYIHVL